MFVAIIESCDYIALHIDFNLGMGQVTAPAVIGKCFSCSGRVKAPAGLQRAVVIDMFQSSLKSQKLDRAAPVVFQSSLCFHSTRH